MTTVRLPKIPHKATAAMLLLLKLTVLHSVSGGFACLQTHAFTCSMAWQQQAI